MNAQLLVAHFNRISDAPDAVQRLRRFVLDLAVRGKLVEQNADDALASQLLTRIGAKSVEPAVGGAIAKHGIKCLVNGDAPFEIPHNWVWVRLGDICSKTGSGSTPRGGKSVYQRNGVPFLRSQNVYDDGLHLEDVAYIAQQTHEKMSGTAVQPGDLLLNITGGSIGRCCRVPNGFAQANVSQHVAIIRVAIDDIQSYLHLLIRSPYFQSFVLKEQTGAGRGGLPKNRMDRIPVALPPQPEQNRIVAKVNELMALCDRFEAAQKERRSRRNRLTSAALHHLSNGGNAEDFQDHARFYLTHLPRLTTHREHIHALRKTILNLAVRGQLVSQDPADEPASEILKQIQAEKARLVKAGEAKEYKHLSANALDPALFDISQTWRWVTVGEIAFGFRYGTSVKCSYEQKGEPVLRIPNMDNGRINAEDLKFGPLSKREAEELRLRLGDILMVRSNGSLDLVGRPALVEANTVGYCYAGYLVRVRTSVKYLDTRYLLLALSTTHVRDQIEIPIRTTVGLKNVNATELSALAIPLPPLAEQRRIVTRVEELMALCGRLQTQLSLAQNESSRLLDAVLNEALNDNQELGDRRRALNG